MSDSKKGTEVAQEQTEKVVNNIKQLLEDQLLIIQRKRELVDRRRVFISKHEKLTEFLNVLNQDSDSGNFETQNAKISFILKNSGYREEECFGISVVSLVEKFCNELIGEIETTISKIENELLMQ